MSEESSDQLLVVGSPRGLNAVGDSDTHSMQTSSQVPSVAQTITGMTEEGDEGDEAFGRVPAGANLQARDDDVDDSQLK